MRIIMMISQKYRRFIPIYNMRQVIITTSNTLSTTTRTTSDHDDDSAIPIDSLLSPDSINILMERHHSNHHENTIRNQTSKVIVEKYISLYQQQQQKYHDNPTSSTLHDDTTTNHMITNTMTNNNNNEIESSNISIELRDDIRHQAQHLYPFLVDIRRTFHRHPEIMYQEQYTSKIIQTLLHQMNISYTTGWGKNIHHHHFHNAIGGYGIVADIGTGMEPCIILRADMDALPIFERTMGIDTYKSVYDHRMHACGHDGHMTMLLGAASILKSMESSIPGTVRFIFQPAEEGGAGGKRMIEEGILLQYPKPSYAFGLHVWPTLPSGTIASRIGPIMAACERFDIIIHGVGGHAAMPSQTIDPIVTASAIIMNLQAIVSRNTNPLEAAVCSITQVDSGSGAYNVIPDTATLKGTIRSLSTETLLQLRDKVQHIVEMTAKTYGCNVTIEYSPDYYPVTVNDPWLYTSISQPIGGLISDEGYVRDIEPTMGAEDFSFIAQCIPSTFFFVGQGSGMNPTTNYGLHHPQFALDESILPKGVELHVNLAIRTLTNLKFFGQNCEK